MALDESERQQQQRDAGPRRHIIKSIDGTAVDHQLIKEKTIDSPLFSSKRRARPRILSSISATIGTSARLSR
jgi:hypothetical protein